MALATRILDGDIHVSGDGSSSKVFIGEATTNPVGFHGKAPVVQPTASGQADQGVMTTTGANTGTAGAGLSVIGDTTAVDQAAALMNDLVALKEDINSLDVLLTEIRTALVNNGLIKGS